MNCHFQILNNEVALIWKRRNGKKLLFRISVSIPRLPLWRTQVNPFLFRRVMILLAGTRGSFSLIPKRPRSLSWWVVPGGFSLPIRCDHRDGGGWHPGYCQGLLHRFHPVHNIPGVPGRMRYNDHHLFLITKEKRKLFILTSLIQSLATISYWPVQ